VIAAHAPIGEKRPTDCAGCGGSKEAPIAVILSISHRDLGFSVALCEVCGRDVANSVGFMCVRDGGWSRLEPRRGAGPRRRKAETRPMGSTDERRPRKVSPR